MNYIFQKKEFTNKIISLFNKQIYIGLKDLWIDNYNHNHFKNFQKNLKEIPNWDKITIKEETERIVSTVFDYVETNKYNDIDLLQMLKIIILSSINSLIGSNTNNINKFVEDLTLEKFIHEIYKECARFFYTNPTIFKDSSCDEKKYKEIIKNINICIKNSINNLLPWKFITNNYFNNINININTESSSNYTPNKYNKNQSENKIIINDNKSQNIVNNKLKETSNKKSDNKIFNNNLNNKNIQQGGYSIFTKNDKFKNSEKNNSSIKNDNFKNSYKNTNSNKNENLLNKYDHQSVNNKRNIESQIDEILKKKEIILSDTNKIKSESSLIAKLTKENSNKSIQNISSEKNNKIKNIINNDLNENNTKKTKETNEKNEKKENDTDEYREIFSNSTKKKYTTESETKTKNTTEKNILKNKNKFFNNYLNI